MFLVINKSGEYTAEFSNPCNKSLDETNSSISSSLRKLLFASFETTLFNNCTPKILKPNIIIIINLEV